MKKLLNLRMCILLFGVGLFALFSCDVEQTTLENLVDVQETFDQSISTSRTRNLLITGTVLDPVTGDPIHNARVQVGNLFVLTDERGRWGINLDDTTERLMTQVTKEGHVDFIFPVSFCDISDDSSIDWTIDLPPNQPSVFFTPGKQASISYDYKEVTYTVTVRANATNRSTNITVGPGGTAVGEGISRYFAIVGIDYEDDQEELTHEENFDLANNIVISYDPLAAAQSGTIASSIPYNKTLSGGIGSINPAALENDAPICFREIAHEWQDAIDKALKAKEGFASNKKVSSIFVEELYSNFLEEICGVEEQLYDIEFPNITLNGNVTVDNTIEGTLHIGIGIITDVLSIFLIDDMGEPIEKLLFLEDECTCNCEGIGPHQSIADGDG